MTVEHLRTSRLPAQAARLEIGDLLPYRDGVGIHREMPAMRNRCQAHALSLDMWQVRQRRVLLAIHEHPWALQAEEFANQIDIIGKVDHRLENPPHRTGSHLVSQARGIKRAGIGWRVSGTLDERSEKRFGIVARIIDDLAAEEVARD